MKKLKHSHRGKMGGKMKVPRTATFSTKKPRIGENTTFNRSGVHGK